MFQRVFADGNQDRVNADVPVHVLDSRLVEWARKNLRRSTNNRTVVEINVLFIDDSVEDEG